MDTGDKIKRWNFIIFNRAIFNLALAHPKDPLWSVTDESCRYTHVFDVSLVRKLNTTLTAFQLVIGPLHFSLSWRGKKP